MNSELQSPAFGEEPIKLDIEHYVLDNGLRVYLDEDHSAPLVAVNLWYHVGSKNERPGRTGFAHLFEHMLFSGSENVGNNEHFKYVQSVGGTLNGSTFFDRTNYYETLPSHHLELALWLESDRMGFFVPALTQEKLDVQKNVVKEERRLRYDNAPYGTWFEDLLRLAYEPDFPYHWPTIGSMDDLTAASLQDVTEFFATYYGPSNAVLTISGDFEPAQARRLIELYFGPIPAIAPVPAVDAVRKQMRQERRGVKSSPVQLPRIYRFYHLPKIGEPDWFAADLLANALTGGKASRLERSLVYEQQIAQDVAAFVLPTEATGMFMIYATGRMGVTADQLEEAVDAELETLTREMLTSRELDRAKNQTETDFAHQLAEFESRADLIGMFATYFGDATVVDRWMASYEAVTAEAIRSVAARYFAPENRVTLHFVPEGDRS